MTDFLHTGQQWLADQLKATCSEQVTYSRPGGASVLVQATIGRTVFKVQDARVFRLQWDGLDFLIERADLVAVIGAGGDPQKHDQITRASGALHEVEETNGEPCFRNADPYGIDLRIHGKRVKN
jgi:hypothetical protein